MEEEVAVVVTDDPRLGRYATDCEGFRGRISTIWRCSDGSELFEISDGGHAHGGLERDQIQIEEAE